MTPSSVDIYLRANQRLIIADSRVNVTSATWQGQLGINEYRWGGDPGTYAFSGQTGSARVLLCDADALTTPTMTPPATLAPGEPTWTATPGCDPCTKLDVIIGLQRTMVAILDRPTITPQATPTATYTPVVPVPTATAAGLPPSSAVCAPTATLPVENRSPMPDLALQMPTIRPLPSLVATIAISAHVLINVVETAQLALETPMAAISTATSKYNWEGGEKISETAVANMEPGMQWVVLMNPSSTAWTTEGSALWAIQPFLGPLMPIIGIALLVVLAQLFLWLLKWLLKLFDVIIKMIELIPGE
jgi:hypothetical protein